MSLKQIDFYELNKKSPEACSAQILEKCSANKVLVRLENSVYVKAFDDYLWTFDNDSFIPHAIFENAEANNPRVIITATSEIELPEYKFLMLINNADFSNFTQFVRIFWSFNYFDTEIKKMAMELKEQAKNAGFISNWWQQNEKCSFDKID
jgi:DNA polymerase-3 subunit chi